MKLVHRVTKDEKVAMMLQEPDITPQMLASIQTPTLVLAGQRDILSEKYTRDIANSIPGSELQILQGETHGSYIKHGERLLDAAGPFLRKVTGR